MEKIFKSRPGGIKIIIVFIFLSLYTGISQADAQVLKDTTAMRLVKKTVDQVYNMHFNEASKTCDLISAEYPNHPVVLLLKGMLTYWKDYPLMEESAPGRIFEQQMLLCIDKCEHFTNGNEAEILLVNLCARGILLLYYGANEMNSKTFSLGRTTYRYLRHAFEFTGTFPDFYFFTGLYNYYREAYPEAHPVYKPLFALLPRGDREKGMNQLRTAFKEAIFMKAEASTFLSSNYKYFENDFSNASYFSRMLYNKYSLNTVYLIDCIEDLLLTGKYDDAEILILSPAARTNNRFYQAQLIILRGVLNEKKYHNSSQASQEYTIGAQNIASYGEWGSQYEAYAYFGLSRLNGDNPHDQKIYRKKALEHADFKAINFDK